MALPKKIGPYRISELLGKGGMGEVYRGYDEKLNRPVAIKQIRSSELVDPSLVERFRREAESAAKLRHPSIVQVLHMIQEDDCDYIVMELVEGRTLSALLKEEGALPPFRASDLFRKITEGLAVAHAHGIVHRDIKASNIMVTPDGGVRILDFGLAKHLYSNEMSLSATGKILGTPQTMSPEQANGEAVDHRSDLFSLGAVLYEAVTGKAPFEADQITATLVKVCMHHPPAASALDPRIPQQLSDLIQWLLAKDPESRPQSAAEVVAILAGDESTVSTVRMDQESSRPKEPITDESLIPTIRTEPPRPAGGASSDSGPPSTIELSLPIGLLWKVGIFLLLVLGALVIWWFSQERKARSAVAVLGVENLSGREADDWFGMGISEILTTELQAGGQIRVVGAGEVARAKRERSFGDLIELTEEDFAQLGVSLGAESILWGTFSRFAGQETGEIRIDFRLLKVESREVVPFGSSGSTQDLVELISREANKIRKELGGRALTSTQIRQSESALPRSTGAARLYAEGLTDIGRLDFQIAIGHLEASLQIEAHPLVYSALAEAQAALGYDRQAATSAEKALGLSEGLPEFSRKKIQARFFSATGEWAKAATIYSELHDEMPDDIDLGLKLADVFIQAQSFSEASEVLDRMRGLPEPMALDPRIYLAEARLAYKQGNPGSMRRFSELAVERGRAISAPLLVAEARLRETTALQELGRHDEAMRSLREAKELFDQYGDRQGSAKALELIGFATLHTGDLSGSKTLFEQALKELESIGNRRRVAGVTNTLGSISIMEGELEEGVSTLEKSLEIWRELGDEKEAASVLNNLASIRFAQADWQAAIDGYEQVLTLARKFQDQEGIATALTNLGEVYFIQGRLEEARKQHESSLAINRATLSEKGIAYDLLRLGKVLAAKGDLFAAREQFRAVSELKGVDLAQSAEARMEVALLELAEGRSKEAGRLARQSEEILRNVGFSDLALLARTVLVRAYLDQGLLGQAQDLMAEIEQDSAQSQDRGARLVSSMVAARVRAADSEQASAAFEDLRQIALEAKEVGFVQIGLEAELAAGEIGMQIDKKAVALDLLKTLKSDADSLGYGRIVESVTSLLRDSG